MAMLIFFIAIALLCAALSLAKLSNHDAQQTALLPFADDPEAARQMTAETGLVCERVVRPAEEPKPPYLWKA